MPIDPLVDRKRKFTLTWGRTYLDVGLDYTAADPAFPDPEHSRAAEDRPRLPDDRRPGSRSLVLGDDRLAQQPAGVGFGDAADARRSLPQVEERYRHFLALIGVLAALTRSVFHHRSLAPLAHPGLTCPLSKRPSA